MKYSKFIIFLVTIFLFLSCKKEEIKPDNTVVGDTTVYEFVDIDWVLSDARFYMDNLDNGDKTFYDHFSNSQNESTLDPINGADIPFDTIRKGVTTWRFTADNFILNNTSFYAFTHVNETVTAIGMENGSSRPMTIIEINEVSITFKVHESYGSFGGENYEYYSTLTFIKSGETCNNCQPNAYYGYTYNGVVNNNNTSPNAIVGTKWVVTKFNVGAETYFPNDTLHFVNINNYTINNGTYYNYTLNNIFGNNMSELNLYNFYTIGGDYGGLVPSDFVNNGVLNAVNFNDVFNVGSDKIVWMVRIQ
jgi:hypothetical protein